MLFVDSGVWIDLLRNRTTAQTDYLAGQLPRERIAVGDLVLAEVLQGIPSDQEFRTTQQILLQFHQVIVANPQIAITAAANYRALRARGITVRKTIDTLLATRCIAEGWPLLYSDRDFDPFVQHLGLRPATGRD